MHFRRFHYLIFFIVFLMSCTAEIRIANNLQRNKKNINILCRFPDYFYLTNSKIPIPENLPANKEMDFYDSAYRQSDFLQYIDDQKFLQEFKRNLGKYFTSFGVNYYPVDSINQFLRAKGTSYVLDFKQLELEERWMPYHREEEFDSMIYSEDFYINAMSLNAWITAAKVNDTVEVSRSLYTESVMSDAVDDMFFQNQWTGEVSYQYRLEELELEDLEYFPVKAANDIGNYLMNYIVDKEVCDRLKYTTGEDAKNYWKLSPRGGVVPDDSPRN